MCEVDIVSHTLPIDIYRTEILQIVVDSIQRKNKSVNLFSAKSTEIESNVNMNRVKMSDIVKTTASTLLHSFFICLAADDVIANWRD